LPEDIRIIEGDFRVVGKNISDDSVDLMFTDPPYAREYLEVWEELGKLAHLVLKRGGFLASYTGTDYLDAVTARLSQHLDYYTLIPGVFDSRQCRD
jgi:predicted methyltransferase